MYEEFYRFEADESDPEEVCCNCGCVLSQGEKRVAVVETCYHYWGEMNDGETPSDDEVVNRYYCNDCFEGNYNQCNDCGDWFPEEALYWVEDEEIQVCEHCRDSGDYLICDRCDGLYSSNGVHTDDYENRICDDCYSRYDYATCDDCGRILHCEDAYWTEDNCYCDYCFEEHAPVHPYSYKPRAIFHRISYHGFYSADESGKEPLYLGVELEVDDGDNPTCVAKEYDEDDVYCKSDGSLSNDGFEIVSHPRTLESHKNYCWESIMHDCINSGYTSHDAGTCGLHVHVNRAFFGEPKDSDFAAAKLIVLVSRFWETFMLPFSRRTPDQLHWTRAPLSEEVIAASDTDSEIRQKLSRARSDRYKAINIRNDQTIEFRLFRGTLKYSTFIATLEFVDGICYWVRNHTLGDTIEASLSDILSGEEFAKFDTMHEYIKSRNIQLDNKEEN